MNKTQEALKMAIEALEDVFNWGDDKTPVGYINEAINACKEAIKQQEQEPVAWMKRSWIDTLDWYDDFKSGAFADETDKDGWTPLYTHPAKQLSDDEILTMIVSNDWDMLTFARAIEAKVRGE